MAAMSSKRTEKPTKIMKSGTETSKKHRFESFNQRISKLKIDPIHKTRRTDVAVDENDSKTSYFRTDLDRWKDLNLSENFRTFARHVRPLCDTLPQVVHHEQNIIGFLRCHIEKGDSLSLEPLLSLLANFAHDLGTRFELHFAETVALVASIASKHTNVEVIEWSFTCLAWLFKYLSRLLVPDLRPLFHVMSSLLGKEQQKLHIIRFAAEAMSFLVRKAATIHHKNQEPLTKIIECVVHDLNQTADQARDIYQYSHGLKMLLVHAIKSVNRAFHSSGATIYSSLLKAVVSNHHGGCSLGLLEGVTLGLIHHADQSTLLPILNVILEQIKRLKPNDLGRSPAVSGLMVRLVDEHMLDIYERLIFIFSTVRKGSRIRDWTPVSEALILLLEYRQALDKKPTESAYKAAAVIIHSAPLDSILLKIRPLMESLVHDPGMGLFLSFSTFLSSINQERFVDLVLPYFLKY